MAENENRFQVCFKSKAGTKIIFKFYFLLGDVEWDGLRKKWNHKKLNSKYLQFFTRGDTYYSQEQGFWVLVVGGLTPFFAPLQNNFQRNFESSQIDSFDIKRHHQSDQIGLFIAVWATFQSLWQQLFLSKLPTFLCNVCKVIFQVKSFLGNFDRHLVTFYWSHCTPESLEVAFCLIFSSKFYFVGFGNGCWDRSERSKLIFKMS